MGISSISLLGIVILLVTNAALWTGLFGQRHVSRGFPWWLTASGLLFLGLGPVAYWIGIPYFIGNYSGSGGNPESMAMLMVVGVGATLLGILFFSAGYAFQGLRAAAAGRRLRDLEQLTLALKEELNGLRQGGMEA